MSDADLGSRIDGIRQLGSVVRAMTGIAGARARTARAQIAAVEGYAAMLADAQAQATTETNDSNPPPATRPALVVFCAEQGFVGGFSERVLDGVGEGVAQADLFLIGSRGAAIASGRGMAPVWSAAMPSRSASLPKFADRLLDAVFAQGGRSTVTVVHTIWTRGQGRVQRFILFPLPKESDAPSLPAPLTNLIASDLAASLGLDRLHALLTRAALLAFVAENEARMAAMAAASRQIETELGVLEALARRVRQEAITAEIIEIAAGAMAGR
ncbi:MAG: F0F1 ATP synthase subunit gamma [Pseudotabrizicola sp.]|uniref:F0F1 ATP synthase subunit gamma n=1 Tax=Pseudotabrizicola sp. TaxID=2939647 RepID=UPI00272F0AAA|nr:F0F1 ATP synthase subunit gamma [Pseudotabrizicola sp.]MDP2079695.1 F0F1 ATP synthase subunit gamma [Pseudotabrizicola sp.]MDZ7574230.1 F0F1 ATP synthase subunit gamma [Pseudotabrizicola sp.]